MPFGRAGARLAGMKVLALLMAVFLWLLGGLFFLAAAAPEAAAAGKVLPRVAVGGLLVACGTVLLVAGLRVGRGAAAGSPGSLDPGGRTAQEPPGALGLKALTCPHCGGQADAATVKVGSEGTMTVTCGYCHAVYLVQEEPKW